MLSSTTAVKFAGFGRDVGFQVHPDEASAIRYDELPNKRLSEGLKRGDNQRAKCSVYKRYTILLKIRLIRGEWFVFS